MVKIAPRYTAVQLILLAGDDLMAQGASEFSEWDLTIAAWNRDSNRFGLRGHAQTHPDHKRVMMEIMGRKPHNPLHLGLMEKVRPNYYKLTALGRAEAARLRRDPTARSERKDSAPEPDHYDSVKPFVDHAVFRRWRDDPDEPRKLPDVCAFLGVDARDKTPVIQARFREVAAILRAAIRWCNKNEVSYVTKPPNRLYPPIHFRDLTEVIEFLKVLSVRFPQLGEVP
jgi:DNA-binding PadR family transcriptional regulator